MRTKTFLAAIAIILAAIMMSSCNSPYEAYTRKCICQTNDDVMQVYVGCRWIIGQNHVTKITEDGPSEFYSRDSVSFDPDSGTVVINIPGGGKFTYIP